MSKYYTATLHISEAMTATASCFMTQHRPTKEVRDSWIQWRQQVAQCWLSNICFGLVYRVTLTTFCSPAANTPWHSEGPSCETTSYLIFGIFWSLINSYRRYVFVWPPPLTQSAYEARGENPANCWDLRVACWWLEELRYARPPSIRTEHKCSRRARLSSGQVHIYPVDASSSESHIPHSWDIKQM